MSIEQPCTMTPARDKVLALSGGIGGAKLALGLYRILPPEHLTIVANTGDDFEHLGLTISPDIDTLMYTLAGLDNPETGWGRRDETWTFMATLATLGGQTWFRLGDGDLAVHVERTRRLAAGETLGDVTRDLCRRLGVMCRVLPMSNAPVRTKVDTDEGRLDFQHYFVRRRSEPRVTAITFEGARDAEAHPVFLAALADPRLQAVVFCPSNPLISIEPILALRGVREALQVCHAPVVAVTPVIAGRAIKGPTAKMLTELGIGASARAVMERYRGLIDAFVVEGEDAHTMMDVSGDILIHPAPTIMRSLADRERLARIVLEVASQVRDCDGVSSRKRSLA